MAESKDYRVKFWTLNLVFIGVLASSVVILALISQKINVKKDFTEDQIFTISPGFTNILENLQDKVTVNYYTSEKMPAMLADLKQQTGDLFEEIRALSGGMVEYKIILPEKEANQAAEEAVEKYKEKEAAFRQWEKLAEGSRGKKPDRPKEPKQPQTIQDLFAGRTGSNKTDEQIATERRAKAEAMAKGSGRSADDHYYEILHKEFVYQELDQLEAEGIAKIPFTERQGSEVIDSAFYSTIQVRYLDKEPEIIGGHFQVENLELELATRIQKLAAPVKPIVAFFDGRPPPQPETPPNPLQGPPPTPSEYEGVVNFLSQMFDVRRIRLEEGDSISDLQATLLEEAKKEDEENPDSSSGSPEERARISCLIVAQPDGLQERQVFEISRAISEGIPTVLLVSRHSVDVSQGQDGGLRNGYPISFLNPGLDEYLRSLGVGIYTEMLASNLCGALPAAYNVQGRLMVMPAPVSSCVMASAAEGLLSQDAALMNRIPNLIFPAANGLSIDTAKVEELGLVVEELAWTHEESWAKQVSPFQNSPFGQPRPPSLVTEQQDLFERKMPATRYEDDFIEKRVLAAQITGKIPFFYQGKKVPAWEKKEESAASANPHQGLPPGLPPGLLPPGSQGPAGPQEEPGEAGESPAPAPAGNPPEATGGETVEAPESTPEPAAPQPATSGEAGEAAGPSTPEKAPAPAPADEVATVEVSANGNLVIFNSTDALKDNYHLNQGPQYQSYQTNLLFFRNAIETFALGQDLLSIRRKTLTQRHFEPNTTSAKQTTIQAINFLVIPGLVGSIGLGLFILRRVQASNYERQIQRQGSGPGTAA